jgi:serine protease Do
MNEDFNTNGSADNANTPNTTGSENAGSSYRYVPEHGTQPDGYSSGYTAPAQNSYTAPNSGSSYGAQNGTYGTQSGAGYTGSSYSAPNGGYSTYGTPNSNGCYGSCTPPVQPPKKKKKHVGRIIAIALACLVLGGGIGVGASLLLKGDKTAEAAAEPEVEEQETTEAEDNSSTLYVGERETTKINTQRVNTSEALTPSEVYAQNVNSTVGITTSVTTTNYWGYQTTGAASGSGFILTADGYILTNYHVIEDSNSIQVTTYDNTAYDATIIGYDESNDIAVLKIDAEGLTPVVLGDSDELCVGDEVMAIGNPLGELTFSLTVGYVSALNREVTLSSGTTMDLIQTDAAINSGNSGGALFNCYGEVVGITNAKYSSSSSSGSASIDNIGFAIPISHVKDIITSIIEKGYIVKPYIGVSVTTVSSEMTSYGLPAGALVKSVTEDSPAASCGLQENDIITSINGEDITSSNDLVSIISDCEPGDALTISVYRQGENEQLTLKLTVGEKQQSAIDETTEDDSTDTQQQQQSGNGYGYGYGNGNGSYPFGYGYGYGYGS